MTRTIDIDSVVVANRQSATTRIKGETVVLALESGKYFALNAVGGFLWERLQEPVAVASLCDAVVAQFAVERPRCEADVLALLARLAGAGLVVEPPAPGG